MLDTAIPLNDEVQAYRAKAEAMRAAALRQGIRAAGGALTGFPRRVSALIRGAR
ncbi:MAG: hypothetical protein AAF281_04100 [Pseudomonadota bacterium]